MNKNITEIEFIVEDAEVMFSDFLDNEEIVTPALGTGCTCAAAV